MTVELNFALVKLEDPIRCGMVWRPRMKQRKGYRDGRFTKAHFVR